MNDLAYTPQTFGQAVLTRLGFTPTTLSVSDMLAWENIEGGHWSNSAKFNPLNTTLKYNGSSNAIDTGGGAWVQSYKSWSDGLNATVKTLQESQYSTIVEALHYGDQNFGEVVSATSWGTGMFSVNVKPKQPVVSTLSAPDLSLYKGLSVKNGVYHIAYSASLGADMANLGWVDQNSSISAVKTFNTSSVDNAARWGANSAKYLEWINRVLPDYYGTK